MLGAHGHRHAASQLAVAPSDEEDSPLGGAGAGGGGPAVAGAQRAACIGAAVGALAAACAVLLLLGCLGAPRTAAPASLPDRTPRPLVADDGVPRAALDEAKLAALDEAPRDSRRRGDGAAAATGGDGAAAATGRRQTAPPPRPLAAADGEAARFGVPALYGTIPEKTIWAYWYSPDTCPSSKNCTLPAHLELCAQTVRLNQGSFTYRLLHYDEVGRYVSPAELPLRWREMGVQQQKDSLMNALLARYGGVALDLSTVLLRPLDPYWDEMVSRDATFRGYLYRASGEPWGQAESMAVWFLMSRREGIFNTVVRNQVIGMGAEKDSFAYAEPYRALGDQTITPVIAMFNSSWPRCSEDVWVDQKSQCPENNRASGADPLSMFAPAEHPRTDVRMILEEPREGPQLPFCFEDDFSMGTWSISDDTEVAGDACKTRRQCWEYFLDRYNQSQNGTGSPPLLFVKLFNAGGRLKTWSRSQLLNEKDTFFYHWLQIAGLSDKSTPRQPGETLPL